MTGTAFKTARQLRALLRQRADTTRVPVLQQFFKTGPGQYAEGDVFIGATVPQLRALCRECADTPLGEALALLRSRVHEERLLALLLLVERFRRGSPALSEAARLTADRAQPFISSSIRCCHAAVEATWFIVKTCSPRTPDAGSASIGETARRNASGPKAPGAASAPIRPRFLFR